MVVEPGAAQCLGDGVLVGAVRGRPGAAVRDAAEAYDVQDADQRGDDADRRLPRVQDGPGQGVGPDQEHGPGERGGRLCAGRCGAGSTRRTGPVKSARASEPG